MIAPVYHQLVETFLYAAVLVEGTDLETQDSSYVGRYGIALIVIECSQ